MDGRRDDEVRGDLRIGTERMTDGRTIRFFARGRAERRATGAGEASADAPGDARGSGARR